jgi:transcriptional regulator with XRE-family HTH domain
MKSKINKETDNATLPSLLCQLRKHLDISQPDFAELVGVSSSLITQVERLETKFSKKLYEKIMDKVPQNHITDLIRVKFELSDGDFPDNNIEFLKKLRFKMYEIENRKGIRLYAIICHKTGSGQETKCRYEIVLTASLFNEGEFRHSWPKVEPKYILVDICDSYDDAERKVVHLKHCYSQWNLNYEGI